MIFSVLSVLVLIGGLLIEVFAGELVKNTFTSEELLKLRIIMALLIINTMVTFICNVFMMALQAYEEFFFIRIVLLAAALINPVVNIIALRSGGKAVALSAVSLAISVLSYGCMFLYARKAILFQVRFDGFKKEAIKEITLFSGFLFLNSITDQITWSTDNVVLGAMKGTTAVAVYNVGAQFKSYFMQLSTSVSSVFAPRINQIVANQESSDALDEVFVRVGRIQFYIISLVLIGYCSIGERFIYMWAGPDYTDSFLIGLILMLAIAVPLFQNVGIEIQKAKNMHKTRSVVYFFVALVNVILTIPFSRLWGGIGAAIATLICMFAGTVVFMNYYYAKHVGLDIRRFWKSIASILPGILPTIVIGFLVNKYIEINSLWVLLIVALLIVAAFFGFAWLLSMNQYEKALIKSIGHRFIRTNQKNRS